MLGSGRRGEVCTVRRSKIRRGIAGGVRFGVVQHIPVWHGRKGEVRRTDVRYSQAGKGQVGKEGLTPLFFFSPSMEFGHHRLF